MYFFTIASQSRTDYQNRNWFAKYTSQNETILILHYTVNHIYFMAAAQELLL